MKRQIRRNVFETNSSSMHSLVIKKGDEHYTHNEMLDDCYIFNDGLISYYNSDLGFGRSPFECLDTFDGKLRYAIASLCGYNKNRKETFERIQEIVREVLPECNGIKLQPSYDDDYFYGYVDHQSVNILPSFLSNTKIDLKEFLTNKKYVVIIDGDEYGVWNDMKKSGLVDLAKIETEYNWGGYLR